MFPPESTANYDESEMDKVGTVAFLGGGIGAVSGYTMVHKILASRSQNIVAMESWTFEKKRNFLFSELKP